MLEMSSPGTVGEDRSHTSSHAMEQERQPQHATLGLGNRLMSLVDWTCHELGTHDLGFSNLSRALPPLLIALLGKVTPPAKGGGLARRGKRMGSDGTVVVVDTQAGLGTQRVRLAQETLLLLKAMLISGDELRLAVLDDLGTGSA
eukprot:gene12947-5986_t